MKELTAAQRLIIAADFQPRELCARAELYAHVLQFAASMHGNGSLIKVNSLLRAKGYDTIAELHRQNVGVFADLKLVDIG